MHANCFKPCAVEAGEGQPLRGHLSAQSSNDINRSPIGARKFKTPEDIVAADQKRAKALKTAQRGEKRKADIVFNVDQCPVKMPTRLGPILSERFRGVCASACSS